MDHNALQLASNQIRILLTTACWECKANVPGILGLGIALGGADSLESLKEAGTDLEKLRTDTQRMYLVLAVTAPSSHILVFTL